MTQPARAPSGSGAWCSLPANDRLLVALAAFPAVGTLLGLALVPSSRLALASLCALPVPWCMFAARIRRRRGLALKQAEPRSADAGRAAARLHLQELGLTVVAIALLFAMAGALAALD